jgi:hypothetical protein
MGNSPRKVINRLSPKSENGRAVPEKTVAITALAAERFSGADLMAKM